MPTAWIFQSNPDSFNIDGYLSGREIVHWSVRQKHLASLMHPGDIVYLWRSIGTKGDKEISGIVASGLLMDEPSVYAEDPESHPYWLDKEGMGPALRVRIQLTKVGNKKEVLKRDWLLEDPILSSLGILKLRNHTNYFISPEHAGRLQRLWANTGRDWNRAESIAGLWAYDQTVGESISKAPGHIVANTALVIGRAVTGVYNKVMNFRSLDPRDERAGLPATGEIDRQVWSEFYDSGTEVLRSASLDDEFRKLWHSPSTSVPDSPSRPVYVEFGEAPNDDPGELRAFMRVLRRGQPAFRRNLLAAYERKCCISGWGPEAVLEAAHIEEHSKSGLNALSNGLLLRSDLHVLFDEGLLKIHPETRAVVLSQTLERSPYWELNGKQLRLPLIGEGPSKNHLAQRWLEGKQS